MFEMDVTASVASVELAISNTTSKHYYTVFRQAIAGNNKNHKLFTSDIIKKQTPSFAISIVDGVVNISLGTGETKTNLFKLKRTRVPNKETSYNFHYTNVKPNEIEKCLNQLPLEQNYFWRYAKIKLLDFRGTQVGFLFQYLKEIEFRYNNRNANLFEGIVAKIASFYGGKF